MGIGDRLQTSAGEITSRYRETLGPLIAKVCVIYALVFALLNFGIVLNKDVMPFALGLSGRIHAVAASEKSVAFLLGVIALFLAYELWLKKVAALYLLCGVLALQSLIDVWKRYGIVSGGIGFFIALIFLSSLPEFPATPDKKSLDRLLVFVPGFLIVLSTYSVGGLYLLRARLGLDSHPIHLLRSAILLGLGRVGHDVGGLVSVFRTSLVAVSIFGAGYALVTLFKPHAALFKEDVLLRERAAEIVRKYGSDSLAYFTLRDGKSLYFYGEDTFIAYRVTSGVAIMSGDPVGPRSSIKEAISEFEEYCTRKGWRLASYSASEGKLSEYRDAGLKYFDLGEEPVIELGRFSLNGRKMRKVRQSVRKLERLGYSVDFFFNSGIPPHLRNELRRISQEWRGEKPEAGFAMGLGRLLAYEDPDCLLSLAYDDAMNPVGFLYLVPMYAKAGYSLDITRTKWGAPAALSDFLIAKTALFLRDKGYQKMSLHFLAFSQHYRPDREERGSAFLALIAKLMDRFIPTTSLYRFDRKFFPTMKKRYVVYQSILDIPRVAYAGFAVESVWNLAKRGVRKANKSE